MINREKVILALPDIQKHLEAEAKLQRGAGTELLQLWADTVGDALKLINEQRERIDRLLLSLNVVLEECNESDNG